MEQASSESYRKPTLREVFATIGRDKSMRQELCFWTASGLVLCAAMLGKELNDRSTSAWREERDAQRIVQANAALDTAKAQYLEFVAELPKNPAPGYKILFANQFASQAIFAASAKLDSLENRIDRETPEATEEADLSPYMNSRYVRAGEILRLAQYAGSVIARAQSVPVEKP